MRNPIFRAKGIGKNDKDRWYEGCYYFTADTTYCFSEDYEKAAKEERDPRHHYILFDRMSDWGLPTQKFKADINPETLCMGTEYVKDHKRVFEGDLVAYHFNPKIVAPIKFGKYQNCFDNQKCEHYGFYVDWEETERPDMRKDLGYWMNLEDVHIVGNIFDNPDWKTKK